MHCLQGVRVGRGNEIIVCGCDKCTQKHPLFRKAVHLGCTGCYGQKPRWSRVPDGDMYFVDEDHPDETHVPDGGIGELDRVFVYKSESDEDEDGPDAAHGDPMESQLVQLVRLNNKSADQAELLADMILSTTRDRYELAKRVGFVQFKGNQREFYSFSAKRATFEMRMAAQLQSSSPTMLCRSWRNCRWTARKCVKHGTSWYRPSPNHRRNSAVRKRLKEIIIDELAYAQKGLRLDTNPTLLGGEGGVLDLQTKTVRPYRPQDLVSKSVGFEIVTWDSIPSATKTELKTVQAQLWPDEDQRDFMIRLNAQTLDGSVRKYVLCVIGPSNSGKSLDGELLRAALGRETGYAATVTTKSLSTAPPAQDRPNTEVIGLEGSRLASQFEADLAKAQPSVPKLQSWSGGDPIPVREPRAQANRVPPVTPTWQLHVASNSTPDASQLDDSLRDRFVIDIRRCRFASEPAEAVSVFALRSVYTTQGAKSLKDAIQAGLPYRTADDPSLPQHDLRKAYLALLISKYDSKMTTIDVRNGEHQTHPP